MVYQKVSIVPSAKKPCLEKSFIGNPDRSPDSKIGASLVDLIINELKRELTTKPDTTRKKKIGKGGITPVIME